MKRLREDHCHLTADQMCDEVGKEIPGISKGIVYPNLRVLQGMGLALELDLGDTVSRFEAERDSHCPVRCERCGRVFDIHEPINKELDRRIADRTGFRISYHQLEFGGLCHDCEQKQ